MWDQTSKRHSRVYFERMKSCLVSSAFCGDEIPAAPWNPSKYCVGGGKARFLRSCFDSIQSIDPRPLRVVSGDSFRFWESLACGTIPIQVDFEHYGLKLPKQPRPFLHYLPVRLDDIPESSVRIKEILGRIPELASGAKNWALEHYSPKATAQRLLEEIKK